MTEYSRSKKTVYRIKDHFVNFWFRFIYPYKSYIEEGNYTRFMEVLDRDFNEHVSFVFEHICRDFLKKQVVKGRLPFGIMKVGMWYGHFRDRAIGERKEVEIDIVALNDDTSEIALFECKWKSLGEKEAMAVLKELMKKSGSVQWNNNGRIEYFGLVAKRIGGKDILKEKRFLVFDLDDF